jgi:hypothetical protein
MIGETSGERGRALYPTLSSIASDVERRTQTVMRGTEIIQATDQKHAVFEWSQRACGGTGTSSQTGQDISLRNKWRIAMTKDFTGIAFPEEKWLSYAFRG